MRMLQHPVSPDYLRHGIRLLEHDPHVKGCLLCRETLGRLSESRFSDQLDSGERLIKRHLREVPVTLTHSCGQWPCIEHHPLDRSEGVLLCEVGGGFVVRDHAGDAREARIPLGYEKGVRHSLLARLERKRNSFGQVRILFRRRTTAHVLLNPWSQVDRFLKRSGAGQEERERLELCRTRTEPLRIWAGLLGYAENLDEVRKECVDAYEELRVVAAMELQLVKVKEGRA